MRDVGGFLRKYNERSKEFQWRSYALGFFTTVTFIGSYVVTAMAWLPLGIFLVCFGIYVAVEARSCM